MKEEQINQPGLQVGPSQTKRGKKPVSWFSIILVVLIAVFAVIQLNLMTH